MKDALEFEAKNVEKALKKACRELNCSPDELSYDILSYGSSGIFGLAGAKKAKIRVKGPGQGAPPLPLTAGGQATPDSTGRHAPDAPGGAQTEADVDGSPADFAGDHLALGKKVLQRIVDAITDDARIVEELNADGILFNVVGGNAALLIGKRGQTLSAIQSIVEKVVNKHNEQRLRVTVDIEGYLENRRVNLQKLAARSAEKSKRIGKPVALGQMSAHDRRIIHMALKDDPQVRTQSKGEGYLRKLVIFPKKDRSVPSRPR